MPLKNVKKIFLFCSPSGERKRWAGFLPVRAEILAQKRFALRSVIATNLNIADFAGSLLARSPRLRRGSLRKKPCISELNRKVGQIQIQFFGKANGGSGRRSRQSKNTSLRNLLKCFCFPIFSVCPDEIGTLRSQFFNPALLRHRRNGQRRHY